MRSIELAEPCRNFCILGSTLITKDPKDGKEKFVISTYVAGGIGKIIMVDTHTAESECYDLPSDEGAWALIYLEDRGKLVIGTCATKGALHSFDLKTRTFADPLRLETETYLWNFAKGKDGNVYASTFPGCVLAKYDPENHTLVNAGRVGNVQENKYSRNTYTNADGNILVNAGFHKNEAFYYNVDTAAFTKIGVDGDSVHGVGEDYIFIENGDFYKFYDPYTFEAMETPILKTALNDLSKIQHPSVKKFIEDLTFPPYLSALPGKSGDHITLLQDGRVIGIKGQELFIIENNKAKFIRIPAEAPATGIMTLSADQNGMIWGSCEFGQTIFRFNPKTKEYSNTAGVTNSGGEVYGITHSHGKLFLTSYVGGDHVVYDPNKEWDQHENINPRSLRSVAPEMVRPHGKSVIGPDGNVWTGWCASYGVYGGGVTKIDTETYEVCSWFGLVPEQAIESITASHDYIYAVTSGEASGLEAKVAGFYILRFNTNGDIVWKRQYETGVHFKRIIVVNNYVLVSMVDLSNKCSKILVFHEKGMRECPSIFMGAYDEKYEYKNLITELVKYDDYTALAFMGNEALLLQIPSGEILSRCTIDGITQTAAIDKKKNIYFAIQKKVFQLEL